MKILWLRPSTGENVSTRRERIAEHLEERGVDVEIRDCSGVDAIGAIRAALGGDHDVILGNVRIGLYLGYVLATLLRKPFIGDVSDPIEQIDHLPGPVFRFFYVLEWWILERAAVAFFVESRSYREANRRGVTAVLARNSVNYDKFADPSDDAVAESRRLLEESGVDTGNPVAIYVGSLDSNIHLEEIVEAAAMTPDWEFVWIGEQRDIDVTPLVDRAENVHFLGSYSHSLVPGFLAHASAALCLVNKEQPLKIMEYGAAGLPTLGSPGKLERVFSDDQLFFVDPEPESLSDAFDRIASDPDEARRRAANLQEYVRQHRWENIAMEYYDELAGLTGSDPAAGTGRQ